MTHALVIEPSPCLTGTQVPNGAKNAVLVSMASLIITDGVSRLYNVPNSADVLSMIAILQELGARVIFDTSAHMLEVDTTSITTWHVSSILMKKMRASVLIVGPLLARFGRASMVHPGGDAIGQRPVNYHLQGFAKMGVQLDYDGDIVQIHANQLHAATIVLEYPSVGATENILMAATRAVGKTRIVNAALEPEVFDLIAVLTKMGAHISIEPPATIVVEGVEILNSIEHTVMYDRLEAAALLLAGAITGGHVYVPYVPAAHLELLICKLEEMGHTLYRGPYDCGVGIRATHTPRTVSIKTGPFPGFPTDLQAPMMVLQCVAQGTSIIEETVFENRLLHVRELQKMGALITTEHTKAVVTGTDTLYGTHVIATDIRASCALMLAGLVAQGRTVMTGVDHWYRGFDQLERKLAALGAHITMVTQSQDTVPTFNETVSQK